MTRVEIWSLRDGRKKGGNLHDLFYKRIRGVPMTSADSACVKNWKRQREMQKEGNIMLRLLETEEA
jgi:hypothetical protein